MACVARLVGERRMRELLHQLWHRRLVRIVTLQAVGGAEGLPLVRLDERLVFCVVAVEAERGHSLGQMFIELYFSRVTHFVRRVACVASHVECGMATTFFRYIQTLRMAVETKVLAFIAARRLEQLILIV